jgi:hypothetical protein
LGTEDDGNELLFISLKKLVAAGRQAGIKGWVPGGERGGL